MRHYRDPGKDADEDDDMKLTSLQAYYRHDACAQRERDY